MSSGMGWVSKMIPMSVTVLVVGHPWVATGGICGGRTAAVPSRGQLAPRFHGVRAPGPRTCSVGRATPPHAQRPMARRESPRLVQDNGAAIGERLGGRAPLCTGSGRVGRVGD